MVRGRRGFKAVAAACLAASFAGGLAAPRGISAQDPSAASPGTTPTPTLLPPLRLAEPASRAPTLPPPPPPPPVPPEDVRGTWVRIEDPGGSLAHVHRRLARAARGDPDAVVRIGVYSDSINGTDWVTAALRGGLQERFGDAGLGFVPVARGWPSQAHQGIAVDYGEGWRTQVVNRGARRDGRYGLAGVVAQGRGYGARTRFRLPSPAHRVRVFYGEQPRGGAVGVFLEDGAAPDRPAALTPTRPGPSRESASGEPALRDGVLDVPLPPEGTANLTVGWVPGEPPRGPVSLYGVALESAGPGVVVDAWMLVGAFARTLLRFGDGHWAGQVSARAPDLMIFWMGGNDAVSRSVGFSRTRFVDGYAQAIGQARRGRPEASCLVVSVMDSGERDDLGRAHTPDRIPRVVAAQREVAERTGCAFFDLFRAVGGPGTMARWIREDPPRGSWDLKHLTPRGAATLGRLLERALLRSYRDWLAGDPESPPRATMSSPPTPLTRRVNHEVTENTIVLSDE